MDSPFKKDLVNSWICSCPELTCLYSMSFSTFFAFIKRAWINNITWLIFQVCWQQESLPNKKWMERYKWDDKFSQYISSFSSVQFSRSVLSDSWDSMNHSMPGHPVHHQLPEFTETHVHRVGDAIQPSHPLSSHSPPAPNPSQHQSRFQWVNSSHEVAKVLEFPL